MKQFGLIGFPLEHSFSKKYFSKKFEKENIDAQYELYELPHIEEFTHLIQSANLSGLNVTIPHKQNVIPFLDMIDETAAQIGAVNVIQFICSDNKTLLKGFNTDVIGFIRSISPKLKEYHTKALILGTGGAAKAIEYGLKKLGLEVTYVSRVAKIGQLTYQELNEQILLDNLLIVNASPVGTFPKMNECPEIPYQFLTQKHLLFDAVYNPSETLFLKKGKENGADTLNGETMLIGQAEAAWKIWNNINN